MEISRHDRRAYLRLILAASLVSLSLELTLIRIFSISLSYHFAFMVISIAMLGIGASGSVLSVVPGLNDLRRIPLYGLLLAISIPLSYLLANTVSFDPARLPWDRLQLLAIGLYYIILCVPFFCFGLIVSTAYSTMSHDTSAIYASDLVGAGVGALAITWLLSLGGPEMSVFIISSLLATGLLTQNSRMVRIVSLLLIVANLTVLFINPQFIQPRVSAFKPFALALQFPGAKRLTTAYSPYARIDLFKSPVVRYAPGLSFTYLDPLPEQTGVAIDAGDLYAITDEARRDRLAFLGSLPTSLAYRLGSNQDVLIIEPRSGISLLLARQFRSKNISAIDSNPLFVRVMREYGRSHGSPAYEHRTWTGLARTWLAGTDQEFDLIDLSLMGPLPSATFGFAEDYRFTVEAFERYIASLKSGGFLSISLYLIPPPRTELRLLATLVSSAEAAGISGISEHIAALRSWDTLTMVMKKSALTTEDIGRIKAFARNKRFDLVYYPGIKPDESNVYIKQPRNDYAEAFRSIMDRKTESRFIDEYLFDIRPVTDDNPFFHYYLTVKNIKAIYRLMGEKWHYFIEEGYLLPVLFVQVFVVSIVLVLLPLLRMRNTEDADDRYKPLRQLSYFALLGIGYLFIEIIFIQELILPLDNPSSAASTVIASVLISSGIGSLMSLRVRSLNHPGVLLALAAFVVVYSLLLPGITAVISPHPLVARIIYSSVLVMPAGFLMGIPFPLGISLLQTTAPRLIPWAWAVNGCFSVLAPILAIMLALSTGFQFVLLCGSLMYLLSFWLVRREWHTIADRY
jgi:hypothetical protein